MVAEVRVIFAEIDHFFFASRLSPMIYIDF